METTLYQDNIDETTVETALCQDNIDETTVETTLYQNNIDETTVETALCQDNIDETTVYQRLWWGLCVGFFHTTRCAQRTNWQFVKTDKYYYYY